MQPPSLKCSASPPADQTRERLGDARGAVETAPAEFEIEKVVCISAPPSVSPVRPAALYDNAAANEEPLESVSDAIPGVRGNACGSAGWDARSTSGNVKGGVLTPLAPSEWWNSG